MQIDKFSSTPVYEQLVEQLERLILAGSLSPGEPIPSVRALSTELSVNPNTVQKAYAELESQGITNSVPGVGRYVAVDAREKIRRNREANLDGLYKAVYELALAGVRQEKVLDVIRSAYASLEKTAEKSVNHD